MTGMLASAVAGVVCTRVLGGGSGGHCVARHKYGDILLYVFVMSDP